MLSSCHANVGNREWNVDAKSISCACKWWEKNLLLSRWLGDKKKGNNNFEWRTSWLNLGSNCEFNFPNFLDELRSRRKSYKKLI